MQPDKKLQHRERIADIREAAMRPRILRLARLLAPALPVVRVAVESPEGLRAWVESWAALAIAADLRDEEIFRGLSSLDKAPPSKPFGWDVFLSLCRPNGSGDARRELDAARSAYARREFSALKPDTWQAAASLGFARVFNGDGVTEAGWAAALADARRTPDQAILARQPIALQARLDASAEALAEGRERSRAALDAELKKLPEYLRPKRFAGVD